MLLVKLLVKRIHPPSNKLAMGVESKGTGHSKLYKSCFNYIIGVFTISCNKVTNLLAKAGFALDSNSLFFFNPLNL